MDVQFLRCHSNTKNVLVSTMMVADLKKHGNAETEIYILHQQRYQERERLYLQKVERGKEQKVVC